MNLSSIFFRPYRYHDKGVGATVLKDSFEKAVSHAKPQISADFEEREEKQMIKGVDIHVVFLHFLIRQY